MSATGKTTNFNIPKFLPTETTGWLNGFNPAMERIDTVLKEKEVDIEKNKTDIALHGQTIETLNGKAGELTSEIDSANKEIAKINTVAVNAATAAKESNDKADNASSVATAANSAAESAISSANEAKDTADRALTESADAKSRAKSANDLAILNRGRLDTAESTLEGLGIQADAIESDLGTAIMQLSTTGSIPDFTFQPDTKYSIEKVEISAATLMVLVKWKIGFDTDIEYSINISSGLGLIDRLPFGIVVGGKIPCGYCCYNGIIVPVSYTITDTTNGECTIHVPIDSNKIYSDVYASIFIPLMTNGTH